MIQSTDKAFFGHPIGLAVLFFTEMWERFSFYGMRAILVLFLISNINGGFGWSENAALDLLGWYGFSVYAMGLPGGILADRLLGQKRSVMLGGGLLVIGHFLLAVPSQTFFFTGIVFIVLGVGALKPNISTLVGGLYQKGDIRKDTGFTIFYMGINLGSFLATIIVSEVATHYGWHYGFGLAGIGMLLGQLVFVFGQKYLKEAGEEPISTHQLAKEQEEAIPSKHYFDRVLVVFIAFIIVCIFWMGFEQAAGLMTLYTEHYSNRNFFDLFTISSGSFQSLNPGFIILFGGLVAAFWDSFARRGKSVGGIFKMAVGTIIMGLGFLFMVGAASEKKVVELTNSQNKPVEIAVEKSALIELQDAKLLDIQGKPTEKSGKVVVKQKDIQITADQVKVYPETIAKILSADKTQQKNITETVVFQTSDHKQVGVDVTKITLLSEKPALKNNEKYAVLTVVSATEKVKKPVEIATVKSAMLWLVFAYLLHTLGELCLSPVVMSFITKVSPPKIVATMMGAYWFVTGLGTKLASDVGKYAESLGEYTVFLGLVVFTVLMGSILLLFSKTLKKLTHGTEDVKL
jgi:proton-dependent oligopeptide transporter, POT family